MIVAPQAIREITSDWLTVVLKSADLIRSSKVVGAVPTVLSENRGFLSVVAKFALSYDEPEPTAPNTVVVKMETPDPELHMIGDEKHAFEREIKFYQEVGQRTGIRLPSVYFAVDQPPHFCLVMEDFSHCEPGDQVAGMPLDLVGTAAQMMGTLQARFWNNEALELLNWMPTSNRIEADYEENWTSFKKHYGHFIEKGGIELGDHLLSYIDWVFEEIEHRPKTITHNDLREDNLLFGKAGTNEEVIIIDWQLATRSMGVFDITRLISGSTLPDLRRGHEIEILRIWYDSLIRGGVEGYSWEDARYDLHLALLECICYPIKFHTAFIDKPHEGRGYQLTEAIIRRHFASAVDLNAAEILPG